MKDILLVGYGGHAKSVADAIECQGEYSIVGYTDVKENDYTYKYLGTDVQLEDIYASGVKYAFICVGYLGKGTLREKIYNKLVEIGFELPVIVDPSAVVSSTAFIGSGAFVGKGSILNANSKIGKCCIVNTGAIIEHDAVVGDFSHVSVGTVLCGAVNVGRGAFVGANSTVIQCRNIADYQIVPAGYVVR